MRLLSTIILAFICNNLFSQSLDYTTYYINFDNSDTLRIAIDTLSNPDNIWQIGIPDKSFFDNAYSEPNAIVTDLKNPYPCNDTSSFYIVHRLIGPSTYRPVTISGRYKVDSDSLKDYGNIDFSLDKGETWIALLSDTTGKMFTLETMNTEFTGKVDWTYFRIYKVYAPSFFYDGEIDTVLYRFQFITDDISEDRDGLMFDNLRITEVTESVEDYLRSEFQSEVFPNPAKNYIKFRYENKLFHTFRLNLYDGSGKEIFKVSNINSDIINIDVSEFERGIHFYKLTNTDLREASFGTFILD